MPEGEFKNPREEDIVYADRRISRPDSSLPDWEVPDSTYRPVPIVWFTRAVLVQIIALSLIGLIAGSWLALPPLVVFATGLLATGLIGFHAWESGIASAGTGWKIATATGLAISLGFAGMAILL